MSTQPRQPVTFGQACAALALSLAAVLAIGVLCYSIAAVVFTPFPPKTDLLLPHDASPEQIAARSKAHDDEVAKYRAEISESPFGGWKHPAAFAWGAVGASIGLTASVIGVLTWRFGG